MSYQRRSERTEYVVSPERILERAVLGKLITIDEYYEETVNRAAQREAERLRDNWPEGEGFGSSDMTFVLEGFLNEAGFKSAYVDNRLTRVTE